MEKSILIVDDEPDILSALTLFLESLNHFKVYQAISGNEALSIISKNNIDLVISDVRMPDGDGIFLIKQLKNKLTHGLKFIFMTGYSDLNQKDALDLGAIEILRKPFDLSVLESSVLKALSNAS